MKKLLFLVPSLILTIALISGCSGSAVLAYSDPEETIDSSINHEFIVLFALESNPSTGYCWQAEYDSGMLELVEETFEPGEYANQGVVGAGGTELFRFKGLKGGEAQITFKYKRSWETEVLDSEVFTVDIK